MAVFGCCRSERVKLERTLNHINGDIVRENSTVQMMLAVAWTYSHFSNRSDGFLDQNFYQKQTIIGQSQNTKRFLSNSTK